MPRQVLVLSHRGELLEGLLRASLRHPVEVVPLAGPAGLAAYGGAPPALIVLDATGVQGADQVRQGALLRSTLSPCPWVVLAPLESPALRQALKQGFERVVLDPVDLEAFSRSCQEALRSGSSEDSLDSLAVVLRGLNHEVRNPLAAVSGLLQLMAHEEPKGSDRSARFEKILGECGRIQTVLDEFSHFLRHRRPARERLLLGELLGRLEACCQKRGLPLVPEIKGNAGSVPVMTDAPAFVGALESLAAFAAGPEEQGHVEAVATAGPTLVEIEIRGRTPRLLPTPAMLLFVPYHESSGPGQTGNPALASSYGILRGHEAEVEVTATSTRAVEFRVLLPRATETASA